jgi:hypothetical protein
MQSSSSKQVGLNACSETMGMLVARFRRADRNKEDRKKGRQKIPHSGIEFIRRYLRHVQPAKLRAVRYYGYHHPAAKKNRQRVQQGSGLGKASKASNDEGLNPKDEIESKELPTENSEPTTAKREHLCPCCQQPMQMIARIKPAWARGALWVPVQSRTPPSEAKGGPQA